MRTLTTAVVVFLMTLSGAHGQNQEAVKKEVELLRGTWSVNVPAGADEVTFKLVIYGDESFELNFGGNTINGARTIDPGKNPKEITLTPDLGKKPLLGIYKLEGDTLTICFGDKRPAQFKAKEGAALWALKREKRNK